MLHNGLLNLVNRSTCFGHCYAHHQELATIQMAPACSTSPQLRQLAALVHVCRFERPGRGMQHGTGKVLVQPTTEECSEVTPRCCAADQADFVIMMDWKLAWFVLTCVRECSRISELRNSGRQKERMQYLDNPRDCLIYFSQVFRISVEISLPLYSERDDRL